MTRRKPRPARVSAEIPPSAPAGRLDVLIGDVAARSLRINNLFQLEAGWRANLTDGRAFYEFGEGATAAEALEAALARAVRS